MKLWCDEIAGWKYPDACWEQAEFGLRLGAKPQTVITTTPKPTKLIKQLAHSKSTHLTQGTTYDNRSNLAPAFFKTIIAKYEGTRLGRQELNAEILDDRLGALWTLKAIDADRVFQLPMLRRIVVGVDPAVTSGEESAEWGIVCVAEGISPSGEEWPPHYYVFDDLSGRYTPNDAAKFVVNAYNAHKADRIVAEVNNGGDLVEAILRNVDHAFAYARNRLLRSTSSTVFITLAPLARLKTRCPITCRWPRSRPTVWTRSFGRSRS
jgi:phage terminase large subunit-like protein